MLNTTRVVLNEADNLDRYFDLESFTTIQSSNRKNTYTTMVFDCCRERISLEAMRGDFTEDDPEQKNFQNLHITFGCPPSDGVSLQSELSVSYVKCCTESIKKNGGIWDMPDAVGALKRRFEKKSEQRDLTCAKLWIDTTVEAEGATKPLSVPLANENSIFASVKDRKVAYSKSFADLAGAAAKKIEVKKGENKGHVSEVPLGKIADCWGTFDENLYKNSKKLTGMGTIVYKDGDVYEGCIVGGQRTD